MPTTSLKSNAPNQNYSDPNDWTNGAPVAGDTVLIAVSPPNGPITATNLAITGEAITLSNNGKLYLAGTTSFDATTSLTDSNAGSGVIDFQLGDFFTNNGTINNADYMAIFNTTASNETPDFTNNAAINYTVNLGGSFLNPYVINAYNANGATGFTNNGVVTVSSPTGANEGVSTTLVTQVQIVGAIIGDGSYDVIGSAPNTTGISATAPTESVLEIEGDEFGSNPTFNLNDGEVQLDAESSGIINFQDGSGIADLANVITTRNAIALSNFRAGDAVGLGTTGITSAAFDGANHIDLYNGATLVATVGTLYAQRAQFAAQTYTIVSSLAADTLLPTSNSTRNQVYLEVAAAPCYCPGTLILTDRGEVAVEALVAGDRVVTLDGTAEAIRWIGRRSYAGRFVEGRRDILPVCIHAGALADGLPQRDLFVSPLHAMYLHGVLVPAADLVNGVSVTQAEAVATVEYIHVELDRHRVIWAEGAASESFVDDDSRGMFHNAAEFYALFPGAARLPARYCAPRVDAGEALEAIKREIDLRAGLFVPGTGPVRGNVDRLDGPTLLGWAQAVRDPDLPLCLEVLVDGVVVTRTLANLFRRDLLAAGLGSGCHGFCVALPPHTSGAVEVRRAGDGAVVGVLRRGAPARRTA